MLKSEAIKSHNLVGFADIKRDPIGGWQTFLDEGNQFLATAINGYEKRQQVFTSEIIYNLVGMGIEKLVMAILMKSGNLPYNHTMHDLVDSMEEFLPGQLTTFAVELRALDAYQEICDIDSYNITPPTMEEIARMLDLAQQVQSVVVKELTH